MFDEPEQEPTFIARMLSDPARLRRRCALALLALAVGSGATRVIDLGTPGSFITALTWVVGPPLALGVAAGDAFFLQHGRGKRRVVLTLAAGVLAALISCALISGVTELSQSAARDAAEAALYGSLYLAVFLTLAAGMALGIGRSGDYLARRVEHLSNDDW